MAFTATTVVPAIIGAVSAITSLIVGYKPFVEALKSIFSSTTTHSLIQVVPMAYAEGLSATVPASARQIGPVFVYGVYILLSVAYIVSLFAIFFSKETRDKGNAMDMFKKLNAFFIGAISGKFT
jgi:hypothetical protein